MIFNRLKLVPQGLIMASLLLLSELLFVTLVLHLMYLMRLEVVREFHCRQLTLEAHQLVRLTTETVATLNLEPGASATETLQRQEAIEKFATRTHALVVDVQADPDLDQLAIKLQAGANDAIKLFNWMLDEQRLGREHWGQVNQLRDENLASISKNFLECVTDIIGLENAKQLKFASRGKTLRQEMKNLLWLGLPGSFLLAIVVGSLYATGVRNSLVQVAENSRLLSRRKQLLPPLVGTNEISQFDQRFHMIAERVENALKRDSLLIENAVDLICSITAEGVFINANPSAKRLLGVDPIWLKGKNVMEFVGFEEREAMRASIQNSCAASEMQSFEANLLRADSSIVETNWSTFWSNDEEYLFCVVHDVTQQKEAERLQQSLLELVTVDLQKPLLAMVNSFDTIAKGDLGAVSQPVLTEIDSANKNMLFLVAFTNDLVDLQRLRLGQTEIELDTVDLSLIISDVIAILKALADEKNVVIKFTPVEQVVSGDRQKLTKVVLNFLANAIKWSPHTGEISIQVDDCDNFVEVSVCDNGPGIAEEYTEKIFEAFVQMPGQDKGGTGLGLAICKLVVEAHGGEIGVRNVEGGASGSIFWFSIPR